MTTGSQTFCFRFTVNQPLRAVVDLNLFDTADADTHPFFFTPYQERNKSRVKSLSLTFYLPCRKKMVHEP